MQHIKAYMQKIDLIIAATTSKKKKPNKKDVGFAGRQDVAQQPQDVKGKELKLIAGYVQGIREAREEMLNARK